MRQKEAYAKQGCDAQLAFAGSQPREGSSATPVEVIIASKSGAAKTVHFFSPGSCGVSWWAGSKVGRRLARVPLESGRYELTVKNMAMRESELVTLVSITHMRTK